MPSFQQEFFPSVYEANQENQGSTDPWCVYDSATLQLFTSSLFLAGLVISLPAAYATRRLGRKFTMICSATCFLIGATLNAAAQDLAMLIIGRIFLGFGVGGANQTVPLYLSEMAPFKLRGALNNLFQLLTTLGILIAQLVNYAVKDWAEGWRLSLGLAAVPAIILLLGGIFLPESPNSLVERGYNDSGRAVLEKLRGTIEIDSELDDIVAAADEAKKVSAIQSFKYQFEKAYLPMFITTIAISFFQQFTGINSIMFYVPVLFSSLGSGHEAALLNAVIIGCFNVAATLVAIFTVDKLGRRTLLLEGGIQMFVSMVVTSVILGVEFSQYDASDLPAEVAIGVLVVIIVFVTGFAWSWGPLGWLVPSEIQSLETRAAGMATCVMINFFFSFLIGQLFLSMLCAMEWGVFLFFAGFVVLMTCFVFFLLPETKGLPIERVQAKFAKHKLWSKLMGPAAAEIIARDKAQIADRKAADDASKVEAVKDGPDTAAADFAKIS